MRKDRVHLATGPAPEGYVSIPAFFGDDAEKRFMDHIEAQKIRNAADAARDVTPKDAG